MSTKINDTLPDADDLSLDVVLERRERSYAFGEPRMSNIRPSAIADEVIDPKVVLERTYRLRTLDQDHAAIRDVIQRFELLPPEQIAKSIGNLTTATYTSVSEGEARVIDREAAVAWAKSAAFAAVRAAYGNPKRQKGEFLQLQITLIDERTATATYTILYSDDTDNPAMPGTSTAILSRAKNGDWQIAVHVPHPVI